MSRRPRTRADVLYERTIRQALYGSRSRRARRLLRRGGPRYIAIAELSDIHWVAVLGYEEREERRRRARWGLPRAQQLHRAHRAGWRP